MGKQSSLLRLVIAKKSMKIEMAPRDKLRFLGELETFLLEILRHPEALITDESSLWDFCTYDSEQAVGFGSKPGHFLFRQRYRRGGFPYDPTDGSQWEETTIEVRALPFRKMTVRKILRHTGVDISPVFDKPIPIVLRFITDHISPDKRSRIFSI